MGTSYSPINIREIVYNEVGPLYNISPHSHFLYQWYCVVFGCVDFSCGEQLFTLQPDDSILISPGVERSPKYHDKSIGYFYVLFENHHLVFENLTDKIVTVPNELRFDLNSLINEINRPGENTYEFVEALVTRILIGLERKTKSCNTAEISSNLNIQSQNELLNQIDAFLKRNLHKNISRKYLSQVFHISPSHLARIFRNTSGMTISRRLFQLRINRAKQLLLESSLPISEISLQVGYTNFSHFTHIFRTDTGVTPSDFRRTQGNTRRKLNIDQ
ncbi:MAG: helix-turn-helix transcriptional regulator [Anaerolineaceae bacterium]|nr:helix-turn-helix transcriptional regulator [Anaerolineaceae bacterium]